MGIWEPPLLQLYQILITRIDTLRDSKKIQKAPGTLKTVWQNYHTSCLWDTVMWERTKCLSCLSDCHFDFLLLSANLVPGNIPKNKINKKWWTYMIIWISRESCWFFFYNFNFFVRFRDYRCRFVTWVYCLILRFRMWMISSPR